MGLSSREDLEPEPFPASEYEYGPQVAPTRVGGRAANSLDRAQDDFPLEEGSERVGDLFVLA